MAVTKKPATKAPIKRSKESIEELKKTLFPSESIVGDRKKLMDLIKKASQKNPPR